MLLGLIVFTGCKKVEKNSNPFFNKYDTPFEVPPFNLIKTAHFMPAFLEGFEEQTKEIHAICNNKDKPTFDNTIKALQYTGQFLQKVNSVFGTLNSANTNDSLQAISRELSPISSKHRDDINLNDTLFQRVKSVYENKDKFKLSDEEKKLLD